jgi:hypothetical protein
VEDNEPGHARTFMIQEKPSVLQKIIQKKEKKNDFFSRFYVGQFGPPGSGTGSETPDGTMLVTCGGQ